MKETVTLTQPEQTRVLVLNRILQGQLTAAEAAHVLSLSVRQVRRLLAAYREDGVAAMVHGNRGRVPAHTISPELRQQIIFLAHTRYAGCNDQHLTELLAEHEGLHLSRSALRRILRSVGLRSPRTRRAPKHRQPRERKAQPGMLVQIDGSPHRWLEARAPRCSLLAAIDDATSQVVAAVFREHEDSPGYFLLLQQLVTSQGCPVAVYHDLDSTADPTRGEQEGSAYHGYYGQHMYHPLLVFDGETNQLISARLRPGNAHASWDAVAELERITAAMRARWPDVELEIRADGGFAVPELYAFCEVAGITYTIGLVPNARLEWAAIPLHVAAQYRWDLTGEDKVRFVSDMRYQAGS